MRRIGARKKDRENWERLEDIIYATFVGRGGFFDKKTSRFSTPPFFLSLSWLLEIDSMMKRLSPFW